MLIVVLVGFIWFWLMMVWIWFDAGGLGVVCLDLGFWVWLFCLFAMIWVGG